MLGKRETRADSRNEKNRANGFYQRFLDSREDTAMNRQTRHSMSKVILSSVILASTLLIQLGVDGQATVYNEQDKQTQQQQFASSLTTSFSRSSHLWEIPPLTTKVHLNHTMPKQSTRVQGVKNKKQLGLTLFFLGIAGQKI